MNKLISMGDCIIDFLPSAPGDLTYSAKMGGAPANVAVAVAKLGAPSYYYGKLASDNFGNFLLRELNRYGVKTDLCIVDGSCKTGLVFVDLYENGERDFFFYRDAPADANLYPEEVKPEIFEKGDVLHFCSVALMESPTKHAHEVAVKYARSRGALVSFDVNVRMNLWNDVEKLKKTVYEFLPYADLIKVTDDELLLLTGITDEKQSAGVLFDMSPNAKLIFITKGEKGSTIYDRSLNCKQFAAKAFAVVDATGAGDCYIGSIIYKLLCKEAELTLDKIDDAVQFACKACAIVISKKGAAPSMPTRAEVEKL